MYLLTSRFRFEAKLGDVWEMKFMAQQKGFKRAQKVAVRKQKQGAQARKANLRRVERAGELAAKEVAQAKDAVNKKAAV
jgi:demethoxyubiquinone hydroxylase (CLK1/Coq7/Cat5 family)